MEQTVSFHTTVLLRHMRTFTTITLDAGTASLGKARKGQGHKSQMSVVTDLLVLVTQTVCYIARGPSHLTA